MSSGLLACSPDAPARSVASPPLAGAQAARVAKLREELQASVQRMEAWGLDGQVRKRAASLLADLGDEPYAHYPGFVLGRRELTFFTAWNGPTEAGGTTPRALAFDQPDHPLHVIEAYAKAFRERGIDFLVVPIPRRIQIYPDRLPDFPPQGTDFPGAGAATTRLLLALAERGIESIDLLPLFAAARESKASDDDRFLFHDYNAHWTPRAARIAADAVARYVGSLEGFPPPAAIADRDFVVRRERAMYQLPPHIPEAEAPVPVWVDRVLGLDGAPVDYRNRESPILVLGDSHCSWYGGALGGDFGAQLHARLGVPIDTIVLDDGGSEAVWTNLARRRNGLQGKRVVVWIFAANVLLDERLQYVEPSGDAER
jgi:hypothetical protein